MILKSWDYSTEEFWKLIWYHDTEESGACWNSWYTVIQYMVPALSMSQKLHYHGTNSSKYPKFLSI